MMIIGIWAEDEQGLIGQNEKMPWHLPAEQQHFKKTTMGQAILMGRKTFDGMQKRVLPGRISIVLTRDQNYRSTDEHVLIMHSLEEVLKWYRNQEKDLFITGGAEILALFEKELEILYRTLYMVSFLEMLISQPLLILRILRKFQKTSIVKMKKILTTLR